MYGAQRTQRVEGAMGFGHHGTGQTTRPKRGERAEEVETGEVRDGSSR